MPLIQYALLKFGNNVFLPNFNKIIIVKLNFTGYNDNGLAKEMIH